jgi:hypothetical protein
MVEHKIPAIDDELSYRRKHGCHSPLIEI